ncbi:MAG: aminoacyl-tRNA hydrolase [bacterium]
MKMDKHEGVRVIVGLGNPGRRYMRTRHNIGFMALDTFTGRLGRPFKQKKTPDFIRADYNCGIYDLITIKPQMYMNLSGEALMRVGLNWQSLKSSMLVVYDDVTIDLGRIRLRRSGSAGGHKGIKNIIDVIGSQEIARLRVGVGNNPEMDMADYVLQAFGKEEKKLLPDMLELAADAIEAAVEDGVDSAMNRFNSGAEK